MSAVRIALPYITRHTAAAHLTNPQNTSITTTKIYLLTLLFQKLWNKKQCAKMVRPFCWNSGSHQPYVDHPKKMTRPLPNTSFWEYLHTSWLPPARSESAGTPPDNAENPQRFARLDTGWKHFARFMPQQECLRVFKTLHHLQRHHTRKHPAGIAKTLWKKRNIQAV